MVLPLLYLSLYLFSDFLALCRKVPSNKRINTFCRKDKNCITVEQLSDDKEMLRKFIPNPVLTFEHAFHNYRKFYILFKVIVIIFSP